MKELQKLTLKMPPASFGQNLVRYETLAGEDYQVYPCIMLVEGVHQGVDSDPVYYSPNTLAESAPMWNNVPVTVGHPVNIRGDHVLCNDDGTIRAQWQIGHIANARVEDGKLKADLWINVRRANDKASGLITFLQNGGELQVSTGMLAGLDGTAGVWNEKDYVGTVNAIVPDHLALLPGGMGACSWTDGCGVRVNQKLKKGAPIIINEQDIGEQLARVHRFVDSLDVMDAASERYTKINFVRAVYEDYFVYQQRTINPDGAEETKLYRQDYTISDGNLEPEGDAVEVVEDIKYVVKANQSIHNKGGNNMAENTENKCCPEKVDALITNEASAYTEEDRDWLESLNEDQVDKMANTEEVNEPEVDPKPTGEEITLASYLNDAPQEIRAVLNEGMKALDAKRQGLMDGILNHDGNSFDTEQLKAMDTEMLQGIAALIPEKTAKPNFSGANPQNSTVVNEGEAEEPYVPVTLSDSLGKSE